MWEYIAWYTPGILYNKGYKYMKSFWFSCVCHLETQSRYYYLLCALKAMKKKLICLWKNCTAPEFFIILIQCSSWWCIKHIDMQPLIVYQCMQLLIVYQCMQPLIVYQCMQPLMVYECMQPLIAYQSMQPLAVYQCMQLFSLAKGVRGVLPHVRDT